MVVFVKFIDKYSGRFIGECFNEITGTLQLRLLDGFSSWKQNNIRIFKQLNLNPVYVIIYTCILCVK
jgi:hypothetical protein